MARIEEIVVIPDLHCPYHDRQVWDTILETIRRLRPAGVVVIGDFADFYSISRHPKDPNRARTLLEDEIEAVKRERKRLEKAAGKAWLQFCKGNHETRFDRLIEADAPQMHSLLSVRSALDFGPDWGWTEYGDYFRSGKCHYTHDVGRCGVNTARQSLVDFQGNLVVGHSHRAGIAYAGTVRGDSHFCMNVGWAGDYNAVDYVPKARARRDWQHALGQVSQDSSGDCWATLVPVIKGRVVVNGMQISARKAGR